MADFTMDRFSLKGRTALVTGAERGIGLEIAKGLAAAGADIIIAGLMEEEFPKAEAAVRAKGVSCTVLKADISKEEDVLRLAEQAWEIFPNGLDILVNNAGVNKLAPAEEMPLEVWLQTWWHIRRCGQWSVLRTTYRRRYCRKPAVPVSRQCRRENRYSCSHDP